MLYVVGSKIGLNRKVKGIPLQQKHRAAKPAEPRADEIQRRFTALPCEPIFLVRQIEKLHWQCADQRWNPECKDCSDHSNAHEKGEEYLLGLPTIGLAPLTEMRRNNIGQPWVVP